MADLAYKQYRITVESVTPMLHHNGALASPLNQISKAMKNISSKRKKTDADYIELGDLEFIGGLYTKDGKITVPSQLIEAWLVEGAKMHKEGQIALSSMFADQNVNFAFDGPQTVEERKKDSSCRLVAPVRVQRNKVERTRPIFENWTLTFTVSVIDQQVPREMLERWAGSAATFKGLGDWRPRYGRGKVMKFEALG